MDEPITPDEAKKQARIDGTYDDEAIVGYISAAREWVERETNVLLVEREVVEEFDTFAARMPLRAWPVSADQPVTVTYRDATGTEAEITDARVIALTRPALLRPADGARWPSATARAEPITVAFTAGYNDPTKIPPMLRQAMLVLIAAYYDDREGGDMLAKAEASARSLCRKFRRRIL